MPIKQIVKKEIYRIGFLIETHGGNTMQVVAHNLASQFTNRQLNMTTDRKTKSAEKLSSGYRINRSADDAAGLQISEKMRWLIRGLNKASNNCQDAASFCQVADGAMNEMHDMVARMKELSVQAANGTNTKSDRTAIQAELNEICEEMQRISDGTEFNTIKVFGKERQCVVTNGVPGNSGVTQISEEVYSIVGNNYGLAEVIGSNNLSSSNKLNDVLNYSGSSWNTTGKEGVKYKGTDKSNSEMNSILQAIDSRLSVDYQTLITNSTTSPSFGTWQGNTFIYDNGTGKNVTLNFSQNMLYSGTINDYTIDGNTGTKVYTGRNYLSTYANHVGGSAVSGNSYGSVWIDFAGAGSAYKIEDLYDEGFNTTCATCSKYYSIKFTDNGSQTNADGVRYNYVDDRAYPRLEIDISDCTSGEDIVQHIMSAVKSCNQFENHYTQYAYNDANKTRLYIYDNRTYEINGGRSTFEPTYRREDGTMNFIEEKNVTNPTTGNVTTYTDKDLWIQAGVEKLQGIWLEKPWINNSILGINGISVLTGEDAQAALGICDKATEIISSERSKIGAYQNRFSHMISIDDNMSENTQAAESRIRDTDMAEEMVNYSKHNMLEQVGQSMLAQANQSNQGILSLLS